MLPLVAQIQMPVDDAMDVACGALRDAESLSTWAAVASLGAVAFAWWHRGRAASGGQHGVWAAIMALAGAAQVLVAMWLVPMGCLSWHALALFVGNATPWLVAAGLFRAAVAPAERLPSSQPGDPFA